MVDGNYSVVRDVVWQGRHGGLVRPALLLVLSRTIRRTLRRVATREELWNGNREPFSNLWSLDPQKSIIAWAATRHGVYRRRYLAAENDPRWVGCISSACAPRVRRTPSSPESCHRARQGVSGGARTGRKWS